MEKIEKINVVVPENYDPAKPIIIQILEGKAPEPVKTLHPKEIKIIGDITTPLAYAIDRFQPRAQVKEDEPASELTGEAKKAIVTYCDKASKPYIQLETDPTSPLSAVIRGELKKNPDLDPFQFNKAAVFTNEEFIKVIREMGHCFSSIQEAKALIKQLQNFSAKFETEVEKNDDRKGNTVNSNRTILEASRSGIPANIAFNMPLFSGGQDVEFVAEVEIDVVMRSNTPEAKFGFFCIEITDKMTKDAVSIVRGEVAKLNQYFTTIRVES